MGDPASVESSGVGTRFLYFASIYFVATGTLYLWGYWGFFAINVLAYISTADIVKVTLYPVIVVLIGCVGGVLVGELGGADFLLSGIPDKSRLKDWRAWRRPKSIFLLAVIAGMVVDVFRSESGWFIAALLVALPVASTLRRTRLFASLLPNEAARANVLYVLALVPGFSFATGRDAAFRVALGSSAYFVQGEQLSRLEALSGSSPETRWKFLGPISDYVFFASEDNKSIIIARADKFDGFSLKVP